MAGQAPGAYAQTTRLLAWDEDSTATVTGFAVTVDGVRSDYGLSPMKTDGTCGCAIGAWFLGGRHIVVVSAYNDFGERPSPPFFVGPTAQAGGPYSGTAGVALSVSGAGSSDLSAAIVSYAWNWGDGTSITTSSTASASHVYGSAGAYAATLTVTDQDGATDFAAALVSVGASSPPTSTPFTGTPAAVPGSIQASDFDNGGEGVAYHDATIGNKGGAYRQTDVDLEPSSDGGYNVGWIRAGEWLNYTVSVASAGLYTVTFRVASLGLGGTFHLEMNGIVVTNAIAVPDTGGWQMWQSVTTTAMLSSGTQVARLVMDTAPAGGLGNLTSMTFAVVPTPPPPPVGSTPFTGTAVSLPGTLEAENFDNGGEGVAYHDTTPGNKGGAFRSTDVDLEVASSGGYDVGWTKPGEWLNYSVNVTTAGSYTVNVRVASAGQGGTFHLEMNGVDVTGRLTVPDTGGWQNWQTVSRTVSLTAGPQVARLVMDSIAVSVGNFDSIEFVRGATPPPP